MLDRRQALIALGAGGLGILAAGVPDVLQGGASTATAADHQKPAGSGPGGGGSGGRGDRPHPSPPVHKDPAYAPDIKATNPAKPVFYLDQLTPPPPPNSIALSLDDGPHPVYTPMILDVLAEHNVVATFSMIGQQVTEFPKLVNRVVEAGHQISNHTVTHNEQLPHLGMARMKEEIVGCSDRISHVTGFAPHLFRSPAGNYSPAVLDLCGENGMTCLYWSVDPMDWRQPQSTASHIASVLQTAKANDILLSHDGGGNRQRTVEALRTVIPALKARGLNFVAL
jgi:peptidoglycan/xylan/chitin deacetylase (PgdA/CDA1 family)